jgi:hypothetical protein
VEVHARAVRNDRLKAAGPADFSDLAEGCRHGSDNRTAEVARARAAWWFAAF